MDIMVYNWIRDGLAYLPHQCLLCAASLRTEADICSSCREDFVFNHQACQRCAAPLEQPGICGHCLQNPPLVHKVIAPFLYQPPLDQLVHRFKFRAQPGLSHCLGSLMVEFISTSKTELPDCLIPVPLHRYRQAVRGYNQSHELATAIAAELQLNLNTHSCHRIKYTAAQSSLHKDQRTSNLSRAFEVRLDQNWEHVTLVDDVYTTGQTINTLASALLAQGVKRVDAWVLARTAEHH